MYYYADRPLVRARAYEVVIKRLNDLTRYVSGQEKHLVTEAIALLIAAIAAAEEANRTGIPKPTPVAPKPKKI